MYLFIIHPGDKGYGHEHTQRDARILARSEEVGTGIYFGGLSRDFGGLFRIKFGDNGPREDNKGPRNANNGPKRGNGARKANSGARGQRMGLSCFHGAAIYSAFVAARSAENDDALCADESSAAVDEADDAGFLQGAKRHRDWRAQL